MTHKRVGVFGWGVVAPKSPNIEAFRRNLECSESWLAPFNGFGPDNFLVGVPEFRFEDYQPWIDSRFAPRHYRNLKEKMDFPTLYALGAFLQALEQNSGLEEELRSLGPQAHVYIGTGLGSLSTIHDASIKLHEAQARWNAFWQDRPAELEQYLEELAAIDGMGIEGEIESAKLNVIREREKRRARLQEKWQAPEPPWNVSANVIWNIHNTPAAQVSILGHITGLAFAPVAACSTFGVALRLAMRAIQCGDAKLVVVGATDPPPHPLTVGAFYNARVLAAGKKVSVPLTRLEGTHVAGGSIIWIVGDLEYYRAKGFRPLGLEPVAVGTTSDAHHIITPTVEGPSAAISQALDEAEAQPGDLATWDLHATATPGDYAELTTLRKMLPAEVIVTARKGTFGHGMGAGGGWELTAQYLGYEEGRLFPTPLERGQLNRSIAALHDCLVFDSPCDFPSGLAGKLSMGIGGINACVISRPLDGE
ncbi:MAG TPA: beta-ketoacyl synthase N-terminal-like domain-containing protein [Bryobacteraceae bacterium]|nr:beta-ketoacyl synthase N-terminal-like domain-containing protein [Bryobacteraceae bacterium]